MIRRLLGGRRRPVDPAPDPPATPDADDTATTPRHITVYTRQGCHLCEQAVEIVQALAGGLHTVELVDIDTRPELVDEYTIRVPVVAVDGAEVAQYQVDESALRAVLGASG